MSLQSVKCLKLKFWQDLEIMFGFPAVSFLFSSVFLYFQDYFENLYRFQTWFFRNSRGVRPFIIASRLLLFQWRWLVGEGSRRGHILMLILVVLWFWNNINKRKNRDEIEGVKNSWELEESIQKQQMLQIWATHLFLIIKTDEKTWR